MPVYRNDTQERIYFNDLNYVDPGKSVTVYDDLSDISGLIETSSTPEVIEETTITSGGGALEFDSFDDFPEVGAEGLIYISADTNSIYRWDTTTEDYVVISSLIYSGIDSEPDTTDWSNNTIYIQTTS